MSLFKKLSKRWKTLVVVLVPILALPILFIDGSKEMSALYGLTIMAAYWITEALPIAITGLFPVVVFPILSVTPARKVAENFIKNASLFAFVCISFSIMVEKWNLHRRIALKTIAVMGSAPKWLMLGFMIPTAFLSLWVSNTAATAMMLPIASAVLSNLEDINSSTNQKEEANGDVTTADGDSDYSMTCLENGGVERLNLTKTDDDQMEEEMSSDEENGPNPRRQTDEVKAVNMRKALIICICYSSSIGGIGSMAGTTTNIIVQGQLDDFFKFYRLDSGLNFLTWMLCCLPVSIICLALAWAWLVCFYFGVRELFKCEWSNKKNQQATQKTIKNLMDKMGPMTFAEKATLGHFFVLTLLIVTMKLPGGGGWVLLFESGYVENSVPAIILLMVTFLFPSEWPRTGPGKVPPLLEWKDLQNKYPWTVLFLIGGGYALAFTMKDAGVSTMIGNHLSSLSGDKSPWVVILALSLIISFMTEVASNGTTASILCPILAELAISLQVHPLYFVLPGGLACSLAFMLPVATPPNTLAFATGDIKVIDMIKVGFLLNILCVMVVNFAVNTWMTVYFDLNTLPPQMVKAPGIGVTDNGRYLNYNNQTLADSVITYNMSTTTTPINISSILQ